MFTWICPQCGREVPPAYDECPDCAGKQKTPAAAPPETEVKTAPLQAPPQPAAVQPLPMRPAQPVQHRAARHSAGMPTWLLTIVFTFAFVGLGAVVYWTVDYYRTRNLTSAAAPVPLETPSAQKKGGKAHPMQRYIEVTGVRFIQDAKKKTEARFLVVNHSPDDISDLGGTVTVWGRTQKSDEEPVGTLSFKVPGIGPWQSREVSTPVATKLRVYELPDWQNVTAEVQITSP
jgi:hypothetical protein